MPTDINDASQTSETPLASGHSEPLVTPAALPFRIPGTRRVPLPTVGRDTGRLALLQIQRETGLSIEQLAQRLGVKRQSLQTYLYQDRTPTVIWLARLLQVAGGRLVMEFPSL